MAEPLTVRLDARLAEAGSSVAVEGVIAEDDYVVGDRVFTVPDGIAFDLDVTNTGETVLCMGSVEAELIGTCDRCLEEARLNLTGEVDAIFADDPDAFSEDLDSDVEVLPIVEDAIDLAPVVRAAIAVEIPFKVLCREDCKGLCPHCGANLNEGDCGCEARLAAEGDPMNPMSVLRALKSSEDPEAES